MILADTTVWIDYFAGRPLKHVEELHALILGKASVLTTGVILLEILQGFRIDADFIRAKNLLESLPYLEISKDTHVKAAEIYRFLRRRGITIRNGMDCLIAATAIEFNVSVLHNDRDFVPIARHCGLKLHACS